MGVRYNLQIIFSFFRLFHVPALVRRVNAKYHERRKFYPAYRR
jgi:hypothetical protein